MGGSHSAERTHFINSVERRVLVGSFIAFAVLMARPLVSSADAGAKVASAVVVAVFLAIAYRNRHRPSIWLDGHIEVRGPLRTRTITPDQVMRWEVAQRRVGLFLRPALVAHLAGGTVMDLGREGIWATRKSEGELMRFASGLPTQ